MLAFTSLRTRRLNVQLRELAIGDSIYLCGLRPDLHEAGTTALLQRIVEPEPKPRIGQVTDVLAWTVQERAMVVAHYLAHLQEGVPDFPVGQGRFSDYLLEGADHAPASLPVGHHLGEDWHIQPLTGYHVEAIERLMAAGKLTFSRRDWWFGAMAAQLARAGEPLADPAEVMPAVYDEQLEDRYRAFLQMPERDCLALLLAFLDATAQMNHLFQLEFADDGIVWAPVRTSDDLEVPGLPPARFQFAAAVDECTQELFGNAAESAG